MDRILGEGSTRIRSHSVHIEGRELMSVSGVKDVDCFNEAEIELLTDAGQLRIEGSGLHITKLSLDEGQVIVEGKYWPLNTARMHSSAVRYFRACSADAARGSGNTHMPYFALLWHVDRAYV